MLDYRNKVCLITGTGNRTGIGYGIAKVIGELGGTVIITGTTSRIFEREEELKQAGIDVLAYVVDLCQRQEVDKMISDIVRQYGRIDVLINNAGNTSIIDRNENRAANHPLFKDMEDEDFDRIISRNLTLTYNVTKRVINNMRENKYGRIVFISSVTGPVVSHKGVSAYSAAKAGIAGLSRNLAIEEGENGIICNCILPGWIDTGVLTPDRLLAGSDNPIGRPGTPREIGKLAAFLASDDNSYVTGQDIVIDGGNCIQEMK